METSDAVTRAGLIKDAAIGLRKRTPDSLASLGEVDEYAIAVNQKLRMAKELLAEYPAFTGTLDDIPWLPQKEQLPANKQPEVLRRGPHVLDRMIAALVRFLRHVQPQQGSVPLPQGDGKTVFVCHGRDESLRRSMFDFLRAIGLHPMEWEELAALTGEPTPPIPQILEEGIGGVQAVLVILSGDDFVQLRRELWKQDESEDEKKQTLQARPNVLFEAGMAFGYCSKKTVLVRVGPVKQFSDVAGRHILPLTDATEDRQKLVDRLRTAGCHIELHGKTDWHSVGRFAPTTAAPLSDKGPDA